MEIRELERHEVDDLWSIDRSESIERMYGVEDGALVARPERHEVRGWPPGERERYAPLLHECFARGGTFYGAFAGDVLVGAAVLERRSIGRATDRLQLKFLHVGREHRRSGLGRALFDRVVARARALGARGLYVSATPSESAVGFYLARGFRLAEEVDPELFALEPEDLHLELDLAP